VPLHWHVGTTPSVHFVPHSVLVGVLTGKRPALHEPPSGFAVPSRFHGVLSLFEQRPVPPLHFASVPHCESSLHEGPHAGVPYVWQAMSARP
jgi:hypothetical protein